MLDPILIAGTSILPEFGVDGQKFALFVFTPRDSLRTNIGSTLPDVHSWAETTNRPTFGTPQKFSFPRDSLQFELSHSDPLSLRSLRVRSSKFPILGALPRMKILRGGLKSNS